MLQQSQCQLWTKKSTVSHTFTEVLPLLRLSIKRKLVFSNPLVGIELASYMITQKLYFTR